MKHSRTVAVVALCALVLLSPRRAVTLHSREGKPFPDGTVQLVISAINQEYCLSGSENPTLRFSLSLKLNNLTDRPITLNHTAIGEATLVSKTLADARAGNYEPGSRLPERLVDAGQRNWKIDGRSIGPKKSLNIGLAKTWIRIATDGTDKELGVSPGKHFLQVFAEIELSDALHPPGTLILSSEPASFVVDHHTTFEVCDETN